MNTRTIAGIQFGFNGALQGYDRSVKYYKLVYKIESTWKSLTGLIKTWNERSSGRKELERIAHDPRLLRDIGLDPYEVQAEVDKPFWRA